jgi:hypothetical protein
LIPLFSLSALLLLGGCAAVLPGQPKVASVPVVTVEEGPKWERVAALEDVERIKALDSAWTDALAEARRAAADDVAAEGKLLDPAAALPRPAPSPGSYKCRVIRLGASEGRPRAFAAFKPFFCYVAVEGDLLAITKQTGTQRPGGYLYDDTLPSRMIFLGSVALGEEDAPPAYGEEVTRNMAGVFERIGAFRYRLVIPRPRTNSKLDVFELVPSPVQPDE